LTPPGVPCLILPITSDAQFAKTDPRADWGGGRIDLGFIDGLHVFDQALRDFTYLERHSTRGSVIAVHDTIPFDRISAEPERTTQFHTGDVWRLVPCLTALRPDLTILTIKTPPSGLTLIAGLNPDFDWDPILTQDAQAPYRALDYAVQESDPPGVLRMVENDPALVRARLAPIIGRAP